jgi:hypothetical protein
VSILVTTTDDLVQGRRLAMDMMERRIRDAVATLLSKGARALERTAGELEQAAGELRRAQQREREDAERVWSESGPPRREPDATLRGAPLRAVPDTPTDEAPDARAGHPAAARGGVSSVPPVRPPQTPSRPRPGKVDVDVVAAPEPSGTEPDVAGTEPDRLRGLATGTVSEIRAQLDDLTADELRALRSIEEANRNRTTLLSAIDRALPDD